MKYLCLIYDAEEIMDHMTQAELDALTAEYAEFNAGIRKNGNYVTSQVLDSVETATTVRVRGGKVSTTDGPFAETKEQLGGFYVIEARDLNEALQIAGRIPSAKFGSVEVRPVMDFSKVQS